MSLLRSEVLRQFKNLHRTRQNVFQGDDRSLALTRQQINEYFQKNKYLQDENEIKGLLKLAKDVETELKTNVLQAEETQSGVYQIRVTENTTMLDNVTFDENAVMKAPKGAKCCSNVLKK